MRSLKQNIIDFLEQMERSHEMEVLYLNHRLDRWIKYKSETEEALRILARKMRKYLICPNFTAIRCCKKDPKTQCNPECIECFIQDARQRARWNLKRRKK